MTAKSRVSHPKRKSAEGSTVLSPLMLERRGPSIASLIRRGPAIPRTVTTTIRKTSFAILKR